jgi:peroxiredoxin Q/BCP
MTISAGMLAPDFTLLDEKETPHHLSDYLGQNVVLYFYPKDDTPGCTIEACNFRDDYHAYVVGDVTILGVSPDDPKSHAKFKKKFGLPFPLLADVEHTVSEQYGVWGQKKFMGREYMGVLRTTFLIGPDGLIKRVFEDVKPARHSAEILGVIKESNQSANE